MLFLAVFTAALTVIGSSALSAEHPTSRNEGTAGFSALKDYYRYTVPPLKVSGLEPRFNVVTKNVTVISGQTAVLPCSVDFLGTYKVVWLDHRGKLLTFEDRRIISDERISLERPYVKEWNLHVRNVRPSDDGKYTCQVNTDPVQVRPVFLNVHEPAKIIDHLSSSTTVIVQESDKVELVCNVTGVPPPTVTWYRIPTGLMKDADRVQESEHDKKRIGVSGEVLVIHNVTRYCDDVYQCVAYNNVSPAAHRNIRVYVEFPPEVRLPNRKLGQVKGKSTILECVVTAYPHAVTVWRRNGKVIERNSRYNTEVYDEDENTLTLALRIQSVEKEDYGQYECIAQNKLGEDSENMILYEYPVAMPITTSTTTTSRTTARPPSNPNSGNGRYSVPVYPPSRQSNLSGIDRSQSSIDQAKEGEKANVEAQGYRDNNNDNGDDTLKEAGIRYKPGNGGPHNRQVIVDPNSRGATLSLSGSRLLLVAVIAALKLCR